MNYQPSNEELLYIAGYPGENVASEDSAKRAELSGMLRAKKMFRVVCELEQADCAFCDDKQETMCARVDKVREAHGIVPAIIESELPVVFVPLVVEAQRI
jgi:hypothetical protein